MRLREESNFNGWLIRRAIAFLPFRMPRAAFRFRKSATFIPTVCRWRRGVPPETPMMFRNSAGYNPSPSSRETISALFRSYDSPVDLSAIASFILSTSPFFGAKTAPADIYSIHGNTMRPVYAYGAFCIRCVRAGIDVEIDRFLPHDAIIATPSPSRIRYSAKSDPLL